MVTLYEYCTKHEMPHILKEWDPVANGTVTPQNVSYGSEKKAWWICEKGHQWQAVIKSRKAGSGCPVCAGKRIEKTWNSLEACYPQIAKQWNIMKNGDLKPSEVFPSSHRVVWWQCDKGHEWKAEIKSRTQGNNCPVCADRKLLKGYNDLQSKCPDIAKEWHPVRNGVFTPNQVRYNSSRRVWWQCEQGHEWQTSIQNRVMGSGCPICHGKKVIEGENDLSTLYPEIAKEWHPGKNGYLTPQTVSVNSNRRVWWQCEHGHEWQAQIFSRTHSHTNCPICAGKKVCPGYNDLETLFPGIAKEWHPKKNGNLLPDNILAGSHKKVWWQDRFGHEWEATIDSRTRKNHGCPYCSGQKVLAGFNDLASLEPELAKEWHPSLNGNLKPNQVLVGSGKKVWWQCAEGHAWEAVIYSRSGAVRRGCPVCAGKTKKYHRYRLEKEDEFIKKG